MVASDSNVAEEDVEDEFEELVQDFENHFWKL